MLGLKSSAELPGKGVHLDGRDFSIQPILLMSERAPTLCHSRIATVGRLAFGAFRQLQAVVGIFPEYV
jgi:hypothetical protein